MNINSIPVQFFPSADGKEVIVKGIAPKVRMPDGTLGDPAFAAGYKIKTGKDVVETPAHYDALSAEGRAECDKIAARDTERLKSAAVRAVQDAIRKAIAHGVTVV
jgi:predicted peroxiredoxin